MLYINILFSYLLILYEFFKFLILIRTENSNVFKKKLICNCFGIYHSNFIVLIQFYDSQNIIIFLENFEYLIFIVLTKDQININKTSCKNVKIPKMFINIFIE